jgi:PAS domain S-box-containing protein
MRGVPTIVVVDDAVEVRTLVRTALNRSGRLEVVGEGASGHDAVELAARLRPDLMLLDVSMPGLDGLEALPEVLGVSPETRVVMYSGFAEEGLSDRCRALGAAAFLEKSTSLETLSADLLAVLGAEAAVIETDVTPTGAEEPVDLAPEPDESVLQEHLERFQEVFEEAAIGMATMTLAGQLVRGNRSLARLLGRRVRQLVGVSYADLAGPDAERVRGALRGVVEGGDDVVRLEHRLDRDGSDQRVLTMVSPVRDATGRPLYVFLQVQDVSGQRATEEALRLLVDAVQDYAIFMLDVDGRVATWNAGAERTNGWAAEEIIGQHFRIFYPPEKRVEQHPEHELEIALREGRYEEEGWRVRKDGTRFWAHVTITAVRDRDGHLLGFGKVTRDHSERREANARLEEANTRLLGAADDQSDFLAMTAHELRSPVGVLGGTAQLLRAHWDELDEAERVELLDGMTTSASRLTRLLSDLLTASRIHGTALDLKAADLDLEEQLTRIVNDAARSAEPGAVRLGTVGPRRIRADADRLAQMVENLVSNALRYGVAPVEISAEDADPMVAIVVRDAGSGIPEELRTKLFERFATSGEGGTGLGLYIVRELARAQGGDASYRVEDQAFVITLPKDAPTEVRADGG